MFKVKEIFLTLQGEGHNVGRRAVFVRFAGCNMWSGREKDRGKGKAPCSRWCDTDFVGGMSLTQAQLINRIRITWGLFPSPFVVFTGGEPGLQLTQSLMDELMPCGFTSAVETNGSVPLPEGVYWRTVSPKQERIVVTKGNELKLIYPTLRPELFADMDFRYFYLQPLNNDTANAISAVEYIKKNPQWRLSMQIHKKVGFQ